MLASKKKEENNIKKEQLAALANSAANAANSANAANQSQVNPAGEVEKERDRLR